MRRLSRASLWMLTRKSNGSRDTEITAFAVMPSVSSPRPVVTTVTPDGKRLIASRRASGPASRVSQPCLFRSCSPSVGNTVSFVEVGAHESDRYATTRGGFRQGVLPREARSEEHTSELQSRQYLVCRLLLEKKDLSS